MLKIYGTAQSRATRALWAAEELGVPYEHIPTAVGDARKPEFLKVNPNGHVPAIDDDGTIVCESMAINLYLAEKYGKAPLWPSSVADHGRVYQWSFWGMLECESHFITVFLNRAILPADQRDEKAAVAAVAALKAPLAILDAHLKDRAWLVGNEFTIADLNVAGVLILGTFIQLDLSAVPAVRAWLDKCLARPALAKARASK